MAAMKPRRAAALVLVAWLTLPSSFRAAGGSIAVLATAGDQTGLWYLMMAPTNDSAPTCNGCEVPFDRTRPLSQSRIYRPFLRSRNALTIGPAMLRISTPPTIRA
jgi:hypothetical protein